MTKPSVAINQEICCGIHLQESRIPSTSAIEEKVQKAIDKALYADGRPGAQKIRNFLNGTWLGEPLHVVLKDVPIGAWTVAMVFDALDLLRNRREVRAGRQYIDRYRACRCGRRRCNRSD